MPEGVEVKIIGEGLSRILAKSRILSIEVLAGRYKRRPPSGFRAFNSMLKYSNPRVASVGTKGKFIYIELSNDWCIFSTLGLTGAWTLRETPYNKLQINFKKSGGKSGRLFLFDIRNFATIKFAKSDVLKKKLTGLGIDIFDPGFNSHRMITALNRAGGKNIAQALLEQKYISGLGTYLISEILYEAKLSPKRKVGSLSARDFKHLYKAIKKISHRSLAAQTFSVSNITEDIRNENRYKFKIYDKKSVKGHPIVKFNVAGRNIKWVPHVQI